MPDLVLRHAQALVSEALSDTRVVLVNGARQAGKSTLTRLATAGRRGTAVRLLDDPATLRAARDEPTGSWLSEHSLTLSPAGWRSSSCGPSRRER